MSSLLAFRVILLQYLLLVYLEPLSNFRPAPTLLSPSPLKNMFLKSELGIPSGEPVSVLAKPVYDPAQTTRPIALTDPERVALQQLTQVRKSRESSGVCSSEHSG